MGLAMRSHAPSHVVASVGVHAQSFPPHPADGDQRMDRQRSRALEAMAQILAERGTAGVSVAAVCERALISRATFIQTFGSLRGCSEALIEDFVDRATATVLVAASAEDSWVEGVIAGLQALLCLLDSEPACARACLTEVGASQTVALRRWSQLVARMQRLGPPAHACSEREGLPARVLVEGTLASVIGMLRIRLLVAQAPPFAQLLGDLTALVVLPWLGESEAVRALHAATARESPPARQRSTSPAPAPHTLPPLLRRANAHKARGALMYVSAHPGASNKQVAAAMEVSHHGQISKLLRRLQDAGLLIKRPGGAGRPNAWSLSEKGERAARVLGEL